MEIAERKLNTPGEVSYQYKHLNSAPGLMRMKSHHDLTSGLEAVTAQRRTGTGTRTATEMAHVGALTLPKDVRCHAG
jgi:hypothetical protein